MAPCPWGSRPVGHPAFRWCCTYERDVGAPFIPFNVLAAHRPSCEEYAPRNLDGALMMAPQPGVVVVYLYAADKYPPLIPCQGIFLPIV